MPRPTPQSVRRRSTRTAAAVALVLAATLVVAAAPSPAGAVATEVSDTLSVVKSDERGVSNVEVAVRLSAETPTDGDVVVIGRDDEFADALASGLLQSDAPLLLVPPAGPVPDGVRTRIAALGATRAIVLGGEAAITPAVADELAGLGLAVERRSGATRLETAIDIARQDAAEADTVLLARAFPGDGAADPTQAFADSLAAGGMAARSGWPILLTQTEVLSRSTADYLTAARPQRVVILGGTAAVSDAVAEAVRATGASVERVAGPARAETAVEIAKAMGDETAASAAQVILVEGSGSAAFTQEGEAPDAWAAGFAAAHRAAAFDAPILLTAAGTLPPTTAAYLADGVGGGGAGPLLTCTMSGPACEEGRRAGGLPPAFAVTASPAGDVVTPGSGITVDLGGYGGAATASGTCIDGTQDRVPGEVLVLRAASSLPSPTCTVQVDGIVLAAGTAQSAVVTLPTGSPPPGPGLSGGTCGLAVDAARGLRYVVACSGEAVVHRATLAGGPASPATVPHPIPHGNSIDLDVIGADARIGGVDVPAGSLLIGSFRGPGSLAVIDPATGATLAGPLAIDADGDVVGVAWDAGRGEVVVADWQLDRIVRLDPADGSRIADVPIAPAGSPQWDLYYGDVAVACTGNLFLVSSAQALIRELTPDGTWVADHDVTALPRTDLSGIAFEGSTGRAHVSSVEGDVFAIDDLADC